MVVQRCPTSLYGTAPVTLARACAQAERYASYDLCTLFRIFVLFCNEMQQLPGSKAVTVGGGVVMLLSLLLLLLLLLFLLPLFLICLPSDSAQYELQRRSLIAVKRTRGGR